MTTISDILFEIQSGLPSNNDTDLQKVFKLLLLPEAIYKTYYSYKYTSNKDKLVAYRSDLLYSVIMSQQLKSFRKEKFHEIYIDSSKASQLEINYGTIGSAYLNFDKNQKVRNKNTAMYFDPKFNISNIGDLLLDVIGNKIFLERKINIMDGSQSYDFEPIDDSDDIVSFEQHQKCLNIVSEPGTYLFYGPPGTGKSTFILSSSLSNKRCLKLTAKDFTGLELNELKILFSLFKPDLILLEELDKCPLVLDEVLVFLERIRRSKVTLIFTANNIKVFDKSLIRPGRIDKIVEFKLPNIDDTRILVNKFCFANDEIKESLAKLFVDKKMSHAYVVDISRKTTNDNHKDMTDYVEFLSKI
jgi:hypothetical protein